MIDLMQSLRHRPSLTRAVGAWQLAARHPNDARSRALLDAARNTIQEAIAGKDWWTSYELVMRASQEVRRLKPPL